MNDLFRFMMLRSAQAVPSDNVKSVTASYINKDDSLAQAKAAAKEFVVSDKFQKSAEGLAFADAASAVAKALAEDTLAPRDVSAIVQRALDASANEIVDREAFSAEEQRIADALVTMKLLSSSQGGDAPELVRLAQGYDAIRQAAKDGNNPIVLKTLALEDFPVRPEVEPAQPAGVPRQPEQRPDLGELQNEIDQIDRSIALLNRMPPSAFRASSRRDAEAAAHAAQPADTERLRGGRQALSAAPRIANVQPWMLSARVVTALPDYVRRAVDHANLDLESQSLPVIVNGLHAQKVQLLHFSAKAALLTSVDLSKIGSAFVPVQANAYVGNPASGLPSGHGNIRPVGVGDLLLVKEHVLRYEGGDLAHVENVLKSEHLDRKTKRLQRTETTVLEETETTKEETRDTQTTDRFSLKRETSDTIKNDASLKAGLSVDAKYGPFVEVKANADVATSTSEESSTKQASEFSKDVVARSVSKLVERVLERRTTTTIEEFVEKYEHGFDNTKGDGHISGFYQWIDKVMQAQVYNYGKRLLFDVTVPEPGTNYVLMQTMNTDAGQSLPKPPPFTMSADQIDESNYTGLGALYQVTGLEPPPVPVKTFAKSYDATLNQDPHEISKSDSVTIDDGYAAKYALFQSDWITYDGASFRFLLGSNYIDALGDTWYVAMAEEVGSVAIAFDAYKVEALAVTVEIFCVRTDRAYAQWQLKTHAAILQGYQAQLQNYQTALAQAKAAAGVVIAGRNPMFNDAIVKMELRRQCLTLLTAQQFDGFGALELTADGYAQPNLAQTEIQMPYVRFFEQAFEWEHIIYFFYPFFWGWKPGWKNRMLLDDVDPPFSDFLRAGAARVVFPVRPGFEAAVIHYLDTGELWDGGPPPDISSSLYVPIVTEIQEATGAPGTEVAVGDPWLVNLPTTLVRIRPNDDLPEWQKVNDEWQAVN
jgi:hypothetical protein